MALQMEPVGWTPISSNRDESGFIQPSGQTAQCVRSISVSLILAALGQFHLAADGPRHAEQEEEP
jgi:hypothetical protein